MEVVGTSMMFESWNVNLLGEPLPLNFVASMVDSSAMELKQKGCTEAVMMIKFIWSPPLSLPPLKPSDLNFHAGTVGRSQLKLQGVQLSSSNQRKLEEVSVQFQFSNSNLEDKSD